MFKLSCVFALAVLAASPSATSPGTTLSARSVTEVLWVFLRDKGPIDPRRATAELEATYDKRALARRRLRRTAPGLFDERDLALWDPYVDAVRDTGAKVRVESTWLNAVSVVATTEQAGRLRSLACVEHCQPVRSLERIDARSSAPGAPGASGASTAAGFYGDMEAQLDQIGLIDLHTQGFTGDGVVVGILDTGFARSHDAYNDPGHPLVVVTEWDFIDNDGNTGPEAGDASTQHHHGTYILGTIGAYDPDFLVGGAYDASFVLAKVEDVTSEYAAEEDWFVAGLQLIEANGGDVATSSLIARLYDLDDMDGQTAVMTLGFNAATENGLHCFQGAGNEGHDTDPTTWNLMIPADAYQVVTVGAVDSSGATASFSSDGPTADGRRKPEVLARGVNTITTHPDDDDAAVGVSGTSLSTPLVAAAAACLVEAHPEWTVAQMRAALSQTATDYAAGGAPDPLYVRGYGIVDALGASQRTDPLIYCTAKKSSTGCVPTIGVQGTPSVSSPDPFDISAELVVNGKFGIFIYSKQGEANLPFNGGVLCAALPVRRTPVQLTRGGPPPIDCSGRMSFDFNAWMDSGVDAGLAPGVVIWGQYWFRDPPDAFGVGLTDGVRFTIQP